jgi:4-hydroxy-tetrahydrodipicolinate synthase
MEQRGRAKPLCGIIPPMVTPLRERDALDEAGLERLIEHILAGGVHGLFILGTTGEAASLSYRLRRELIERTCRTVAGRVPVLVGVTDTAHVESLALARHAADAGAEALVFSAPFFYAFAPGELLSYLERFEAEAPLPMVLYNVPGRPAPTFDVETVRQAMELPGVIGLKDSSFNMMYFHEVRRLLPRRPDWMLLVGPEELLAESVLLGGHGGVSGGANVNPRLYVDLYEAARDGDLERVRALHDRVMTVSRTLYTVGLYQGPSAFLKGLKCSLSWLGLCEDVMAEPFERFSEEQRQEIRARLVKLGILGEQDASAPASLTH